MQRYEKLRDPDVPRANLGKYKRERIIYRFKDVHMDLNIVHLLWQQSGGGSDAAEIWAATSRMKKRDRDSWNREFKALGERIEAMARESLVGGHRVSARETFFRASSYFGTAGCRDQQVRCFRAAGEMEDPPLEPVKIPFEGTHLPGYFAKAADGDEERKTLIVIGGGDTILEDLYFIAGPAGRARGYNVFVVEMPGQGATVRDGLVMRPDTEVPMKAIVDYALERPDVHPEKLAAMGLSWGGYMVPRAACFEKRLNAIVANSFIPDGHIWMTEISPFGLIARLEGTILFPLIKLLLGSSMMPRLESIQQKWGARNMKHFVELSRNFYLDPRLIECPTLLLDGETENTYSKGVEMLQQVAMEAISHTKKERITGPREVGADGHCLVANTNFMNRVTFDWLDGLFEDDLDHLD